MKKIIGLILAVLFFVSFAEASSLTGTIKYPDGTGVTGYLTFQLAQQGAVYNVGSCGGPFVVVPTTEIRIPLTNGAMVGSWTIVGNDCIQPANTKYKVTARDNRNNLLFTEFWTVTGATFDVGTAVPTSTAGTAFSGAVLLTPPFNTEQLISSSISPLFTNTNDLGNTTDKWRDAWLSRDIHVAGSYHLGTGGSGSNGLDSMFINSGSLAIGDTFSGVGRWASIDFFPGSPTKMFAFTQNAMELYTPGSLPSCAAGKGLIYYDGANLIMCNGVNGPVAIGQGVGGGSSVALPFTLGSYTGNDASTWDQSYLRIGKTMTSTTGNEWGFSIQPNITASGASSYEKAGGIIQVNISDPSSYGPTFANLDAVGLDSRCNVTGGITTGRCWAFFADSRTDPGSDGALTGFELSVSGSPSSEDVALLNGQIHSKVGFNIVAGEQLPGSQNSTAAIIIQPGNATFHKGVSVKQSALHVGLQHDSAFEVLDAMTDVNQLFRVKGNGQTLIGGLENNAGTNDYVLGAYGALAVQGYMTIPGSGGSLDAEKHMMYLFSDAGNSVHRLGSTRYDGSVSFWPVALDAAGNEVMRMTTNPFVQFTTSYTGTTVPSGGTTGVRNNSGTLEVSNNGGIWNPVATGVVDGGTYVHLFDNTNVLSLGQNTDVAGTGYRLVINNGLAVVQNATANTAVGAFAYDAGTNAVIVASGRSGSGTAAPIKFLTGIVSTEAMAISVDGAIDLPTMSVTPSISAAGRGRMYFNGTHFRCSVNGGAYADCF